MDSNKYKKQRKNGAGDEAVNGDSRSLVDQMSVSFKQGQILDCTLNKRNDLFHELKN